MKPKILLILLFISLYSFGQSSKLLGLWILDKYTLKNGNPIEVNNKDFSTFAEYQFFNNKMIIDGTEIPITITEKNIDTKAAKINYEFKGNYLLLNFDGTEKIAYLLKPENFIELYPEFKPMQQNTDGENLYLENAIVKPEFNYVGGFNSYLRNIFGNYQNYPKSKNYFKAQFIITKNSKILEPKVINSISSDFDKMAIDAIKNSEKYFKNSTGKDFLLTRYFTMNIIDNGNEKLEKEDKQINQIEQKGFAYYNKNEFENAIKEYEKIKNIDFKNSNNSKVKYSLIRLGVSYLAINRIDEACANFRLVGGLTDFQVRNYLINFCQK